MRIIGISGLANAMSFKRSHWPGLDEREYRISQGHDSAAALVSNGEILAAAAEERFSLKKHTGDFPSRHRLLSLRGRNLHRGRRRDRTLFRLFSVQQALFARPGFGGVVPRSLFAGSFAGSVEATCRAFRRNASTTSSIIWRMRPAPIYLGLG